MKAAAPASAPKMIRIGPGEHYVTTAKDELIMTVLGSCVAACIRDPVAAIGGMNHFMLPASTSGMWGATSANLRYGNFAMERLINDILRGGGQRRRLEIKLFGGASMIAAGGAIGDQNADFAESYFIEESMPIAASHLRGAHARRIEYRPILGRVMMLELGDQDSGVAHAESSFRQSVQAQPDAGSIELFD
jgi:chemotaxis protein CheD